MTKAKSKKSKPAPVERTRAKSTDRSQAKNKEGRFASVPLVIAALLIGAIMVAMGYTMHKQSLGAAANAVPQATPETAQPSGSDPAQTQAKPANSGQNQSGAPSNQVLTN